MKECKQITKHACIPTQDLLPSKEQAVALYESEGGNITQPQLFGVDPISENSHANKLPFDTFLAANPNFSTVFHGVVNGQSHFFEEGLQHFCP